MKANMYLLISLITMFFQTQTSLAQSNDLKLPLPDRIGGKPLMACLNERQSSRDFTDREVSIQELSNLLWAANGINREDVGKHTAPTAMNRQNMEIYVIMPQGTYFYDDKTNTLILIEAGNHMDKAGSQDFVSKSKLNIIIVSDMAKLGDGPLDKKNIYAGIHAGAIMQNIYLFCASAGLKTVTRASFDQDALSSLLKLKADKKVILAQTVGY